MIRRADYSSFKKMSFKDMTHATREFFIDFITKFKREPELEVASAPAPSRLKITNSPKYTEKAKPIQEVVEEIEEIDEIEEEDFGEEEEDEVLEVDDIEFNDSSDSEEEVDEEIVEDEAEAETEEVPYQRKKSVDQFFDSDELIGCIAPKNQDHTHDPEEQYFVTIAMAIEDKLKEFNITAKVINVLKGPVVDTFELELGPGVKVAGVTNRTDDLSSP